MKLRHKMMLLGTIPLIIVIALLSLMFIVQSSTLANDEIKRLRGVMLAEKKSALKNHMALAQSAIGASYIQALNGNYTSQLNIATILRNIKYGEDGYFYVYDLKGKNIVHPKQPYRMGINWINLQDRDGNYVIKDIIETATNGSGFSSYIWEKPSTQQLTEKISYNVELEGLDWVIGTGLYVNDVNAQTNLIRDNVKSSIANAILLTSFLTIVSIIVIYILTFTLNIRELGLADRRLLNLNERILNTQEEERSRVSRELHDGVSQLVTATRFDIEHAIKKLKVMNANLLETPILDSVLKRLLDIGGEIRRISHDLRPRVLDELGLYPAIEASLVELNRRSSIIHDFQFSEGSHDFPTSISNTIFRVFQEATNNIEKHANAKYVLVELTNDGKNIMMRLTDDGVGFDTETDYEERDGIGIYNMRQRIESHQGHLKIKSSEHGTVIKITIPLKNPILRQEIE
ncbi:MAG: cache domain-containing protein [Rhizobiales bacterium]|nr:cache domain-containing protein [Hyphomicrobiales bacterium]